MRLISALALLLLPLPGFSGALSVQDAIVPLAPPTAKVHAAYMRLTNKGATAVSIIAVEAEGYAMAHLHQSTITDGVASMQPVHLIQVAPGQTVELTHGGLHVMLMRPKAPAAEGDSVNFDLELADGTRVPVTATVARLKHKPMTGHDHGHDHGHGS